MILFRNNIIFFYSSTYKSNENHPKVLHFTEKTSLLNGTYSIRMILFLRNITNILQRSEKIMYTIYILIITFFVIYAVVHISFFFLDS